MILELWSLMTCRTAQTVIMIFPHYFSLEFNLFMPFLTVVLILLYQMCSECIVWIAIYNQQLHCPSSYLIIVIFLFFPQNVCLTSPNSGQCGHITPDRYLAFCSYFTWEFPFLSNMKCNLLIKPSSAICRQKGYEKIFVEIQIWTWLNPLSKVEIMYR